MVYDAVSLHTTGKMSMAAFKKAMSQAEGAPQSPVAKGMQCASRGARVLFFETLPTLEEVSEMLVDEALDRSGGNRITSYNVCYTKLLRIPLEKAVDVFQAVGRGQLDQRLDLRGPIVV